MEYSIWTPQWQSVFGIHGAIKLSSVDPWCQSENYSRYVALFQWLVLFMSCHVLLQRLAAAIYTHTHIYIYIYVYIYIYTHRFEWHFLCESHYSLSGLSKPSTQSWVSQCLPRTLFFSYFMRFTGVKLSIHTLRSIPSAWCLQTLQPGAQAAESYFPAPVKSGVESHFCLLQCRLSPLPSNMKSRRSSLEGRGSTVNREFFQVIEQSKMDVSWCVQKEWFSPQYMACKQWEHCNSYNHDNSW